MSVFDGDRYEGYEQYSIYGGLPYTLSFDNDVERSNYLKSLFERYILMILSKEIILLM